VIRERAAHAARAGLTRRDIHRDFKTKAHIGVARCRPLHMCSSMWLTHRCAVNRAWCRAASALLTTQTPCRALYCNARAAGGSREIQHTPNCIGMPLVRVCKSPAAQCPDPEAKCSITIRRFLSSCHAIWNRRVEYRRGL